MAEGQTRSMHQVAEFRAPEIADWPGASGQDFGSSCVPRRNERDRIFQVVKAEILPRVSVGHVQQAAPDNVDADSVRDLVGLLLGFDHVGRVTDYVTATLARGMPVEHVFLQLFQPAARRLGELWLEDLCSFVDVTLGLATMQDWLRRLAPTFYRHGLPTDVRRSALLTTLPGDQHTFGVNMAGEFFRRAGWNVCSSPWPHAENLAAVLAGGGYSVVGFSMSREGRLDELAATIRTVRRACAGRVGILVGGPLFIANPEHAIRVGADAVGLDARQALAQAEAFAVRAEAR